MENRPEMEIMGVKIALVDVMSEPPAILYLIETRTLLVYLINHFMKKIQGRIMVSPCVPNRDLIKNPLSSDCG